MTNKIILEINHVFKSPCEKNMIYTSIRNFHLPSHGTQRWSLCLLYTTWAQRDSTEKTLKFGPNEYNVQNEN
jgi:hypothetical protein